MLGIIGDRTHVLITTRKVSTVEPGGVSDGTVPPHLIPNWKGIGDPGWIEVIEVVVHIGLRCTGSHRAPIARECERELGTVGLCQPGFRFEALWHEAMQTRMRVAQLIELEQLGCNRNTSRVALTAFADDT